MGFKGLMKVDYIHATVGVIFGVANLLITRRYFHGALLVAQVIMAIAIANSLVVLLYRGYHVWRRTAEVDDQSRTQRH